MRDTPRHEFVSPDQIEQAYVDRPLSIGQGQTISQPYMVALMMQALELHGHEKVLEVGTGSGYQTAVLASLAARVITMESNPVLAASARQRLKRLGLEAKVTVIEGDGSLGYGPEAPYAGIVVAAAAPNIPDVYLEQLVEGGRLVIPVGELGEQELRLIRKVQGEPVGRTLGYCRFVPLTGSCGWRLD
jgi:protein-L-isoaspartate(D-aspartate) O-methyltransferase